MFTAESTDPVQQARLQQLDDILLPLKVEVRAPHLVPDEPTIPPDPICLPCFASSDFEGFLWLESQIKPELPIENPLLQASQLEAAVETGCIRLGDGHQWIQYFANIAAEIRKDATGFDEGSPEAAKSARAIEGWYAMIEGIEDEVEALSSEAQTRWRSLPASNWERMGRRRYR